MAGKFYAAPTKPFDYYYFNVLEELDAPGEYYLDKDNARLYYYPDADIESARLVVSSLADSAILVEEAENITLDGLRIEGVRGTGIKIKNSRNIILQNVTVSGTGMAGVDIDGGMDNGLLGCEISNNGGDAVKLRGGDWFTLSPAGHYVCDSYLHNFSQRKKSYTAGVTVAGAGFTIQNNIIADAPHTGIFIRGNDVTIKNNILRDLVQDARDMGAIYSVDSYGWRGTQIYNNHFENIRNLKEDAPIGSVKCIYLDNFTSGYSIHHNLFLDSDHGIHLGGGRENRFYQNILCNTDYSIGAYNLKDATFTQAPFAQCDLMPAQCNLWKMKYPGIEEIRTVNPGYPNQTEIGDNIIIGAEKTVITDNAHMILRDNHFLSGDAVDENIKVKDKKIYESLIQPVEPDYAVIGRYVSECRERTAKRLYAFTDRCSLLSPYLYIPQGTSCVLHIIGEDEKGRWAIDDAEISTSNENIIAVEGKRLAAKGDGAATITISAGEQISQVQVITGIYRLHVENGM